MKQIKFMKLRFAIKVSDRETYRVFSDAISPMDPGIVPVIEQFLRILRKEDIVKF